MPTATARETVLFDVDDFKVQSMVSDTGAAPVYSATALDVPGIAQVSVSPNFVTNELKGDAKVLAKKGKVDKYGFSATYGKLSLDVLAVLFGGAVTDQGTAPATSVRWRMPGKNSLVYFKAMFQILQADVADVHIVGHKCQVTGGTLIDQSTDNFGQPKVDFDAIPCTSDDTLFLDVELFDQVTPIAGP